MHPNGAFFCFLSKNVDTVYKNNASIEVFQI